MTRGTGTHDLRQVRATGRGKKPSEGLGSRAVPTTCGGDPRLDHVPLRLIRFRTVKDRTGLSRTTVYETADFPEPYRLTPRSVAWRESEVLAWMATRPRVSEAA